MLEPANDNMKWFCDLRAKYFRAQNLMGLPKKRGTRCMIISFALVQCANGAATYTETHSASSRVFMPPSPVELEELLIEHTLPITDSDDATLFKNSFCSDVEGCIDYELISNESSPQAVRVSKMNKSSVSNPLPNVYQWFTSSLTPLIDSPPSLPPNYTSESHSHQSLITNEYQSTSNPLLNAFNPKIEENGYAEQPNTINHPSPSFTPLISHFAQKVRILQSEHIRSFYLQQVMARFINWCYTNDYANLIYPFLPDAALDNPKHISSSKCYNRIHRTMLLILRYTHNQLSNKLAFKMLFAFPLLVHLHEVRAYINAAFTSLEQIAQMRKDNKALNKAIIAVGKDEKKKQRRGKLQTQFSTGDEQVELDTVRDTILIGCKALLKVPYYFAQGQEKELFDVSHINRKSNSGDLDENSEELSEGVLSRVIAKCDKVIPSILSSYSSREDRRVYLQYYEEKDQKSVNGRHTVFPRVPLEVKKMWNIATLTEKEHKNCTRIDVGNDRRGKELLQCLDGLIKKLSLMIGMIAANSYLLSSKFTRAVIPIMERLQALQLVSIYFKTKDNILSQENRKSSLGGNINRSGYEGIRENLSESRLDDLKLYHVVKDVISQIATFVKDAKLFYSENLHNFIEKEYLKNARCPREREERKKSARETIQGYNLETFYNFMIEDEIEQERINLHRIELVRNICRKKKESKLSQEGVVPSKDASGTIANPLNANCTTSDATGKDNSMEIENVESDKKIKEEDENLKDDLIEKCEKRKPKRFENIIAFIGYRKYILERLHVILSELPLNDLIKDEEAEQAVKIEDEGFAITSDKIVGVYNMVNSLYQWSLPTAYFLEKIYNRAASNYESLYGLSRGDFSFPGLSKDKRWFKWGNSESASLGKLFFDEHRWNLYFKEGRAKLSPVAQKRKDFNLSKKPAITDQEPIISKEEEDIRKEDINYDLFALDILEAMKILSSKKQGRHFLLQKKFSRIVVSFEILMDYYDSYYMQSNFSALDSLLINHFRVGTVSTIERQREIMQNIAYQKSLVTDVEEAYLPASSLKPVYNDDGPNGLAQSLSKEQKINNVPSSEKYPFPLSNPHLTQIEIPPLNAHYTSAADSAVHKSSIPVPKNLSTIYFPQYYSGPIQISSLPVHPLAFTRSELGLLSNSYPFNTMIPSLQQSLNYHTNQFSLPYSNIMPEQIVPNSVRSLINDNIPGMMSHSIMDYFVPSTLSTTGQITNGLTRELIDRNSNNKRLATIISMEDEMNKINQHLQQPAHTRNFLNSQDFIDATANRYPHGLTELPLFSGQQVQRPFFLNGRHPGVEQHDRQTQSYHNYPFANSK